MGDINLAAAIIALGFALALVAEVVSWVSQPDRDWYHGRALAESAKTLVWRFAVCADPFPDTMPTDKARSVLIQRIADITREARDRVTLGGEHAIITPAMEKLRASSFVERKQAYIKDRTERQQRWYATKAEANKKAIARWRVLLIGGEVVALTFAAARIFGSWEIDLAGVFAAVIASGAAWTALKQYSTLASAYSTTAAELAIQAARLTSVKSSSWSATVADAEEAISREHTLWSTLR